MELVELPKSLPRSKSKRPNVVFIVLDTVRVDHLSCYGYRRDTTPNLDAFAAGARQYKNVLSPSPWTGPSHASMFTGLPVSAHGCDWLHRCLDERFATLAGQLTAHGYQTVGLSSNAMLSATPGMTRGFQSFWVPPDGIFKGAADHMHNRLARWFGKEYDAEKPFFLFMNYIEAHQPYTPPQASLRFASSETLARWSREDQVGRSFNYTLLRSNALSSRDIMDLEALYDDELNYVDRKLGEIFAFLKSTGLEENTAVIVTSDHGEHFGEHHLMSHQYSLYEPLVRVPLIARYADHFPAGEETRLVQGHDVYPTILQLAGVEYKQTPGQTCRSLLQPPSEPRVAISEYAVPQLEFLVWTMRDDPGADLAYFNRRICAIQRGDLKLIRSSALGSRAEDTLELYDLSNDPLETRNLADQKPDATRELRTALSTWAHSFEPYVASSTPQACAPAACFTQ